MVQKFCEETRRQLIMAVCESAVPEPNVSTEPRGCCGKNGYILVHPNALQLEKVNGACIWVLTKVQFDATVVVVYQRLPVLKGSQEIVAQLSA